MGLLDGTRSGDSLLFLSDEREIARDDFWIIRVLLAVVVLNTLYWDTATFTGPDGTITFLSLLLLLSPVYWVALRLTSDPADASVSTEVAETAP